MTNGIVWKHTSDDDVTQTWETDKYDRILVMTYFGNRWRLALYAKQSEKMIESHRLHDKQETIDKAATIRLDVIRES